MIDKYGDDKDFSIAFYWFLQASRFGRYSGSGTTSLEEDLRDIDASASVTEAVSRLLLKFPHKEPLVRDDFLRDYGDGRFGRFLLYLLVYRNQAKDWDAQGHRIGFDGLTLLADFRPQWHHVFPRKYLEGRVEDTQVDALANIAVIGPSINIRISAADPMNYVTKYGISQDKLNQQFIDPDFTTIPIDKYPEWLQCRAERLAEEGNAFLADLRAPLGA
jgi:hypothetical protein